jgi:type IV pilus assembly protein PilM
MLATDKILALDIGAAGVKIAEFQASKTHGLRLTNFNHASLGLDPDREENRQALVTSTIRNALREKSIKSKRVVLSVPGQSVFTRFVKLPPVEQSKVVQIIQYEAQQNVPFPIDEVIWDYQLVGSSAQGELEVVLLAIKSDIIEEINSSVEETGLRTEVVDVAPMALYNAIRYNEPNIEGCTLVVDMGARTTNLLFLESNRVFSRSIPLAGNSITKSIADEFGVSFQEAEQMKQSKGFVALGGAYEEPPDEQQARISKIIRNVLTRLHADITRSINFYRSQQGGGAPTRLLLSGGSAIIPYTDRFFQEKLQLPVEYFNPFRNVEISPHIPREELARCAHFFGEVVGLGLRKMAECPMEVNLLPRSIRKRKQMEQRRPYYAGAAVCVLLIAGCCLAYINKMTSLQSVQLDDINRQLTELESRDRSVKKENTELENLKASATKIADIVAERAYWPQLMQDLSGRMVPKVWLTGMTPDTGTTAAAAPVPRAGLGRAGMMGFAPPPGDSSGLRPGAAGGDTTTVTELRIEGTGEHVDDAADVRLVDELAKQLRNSPFFDQTAIDKGVEIIAPPKTDKGRPFFTFTLRVKLAKPISY